jgi:hypothetical protein
MRNIHAQDEDIDGPDIMEVSILFIPFLLNKIRTYSYIVNYAYVHNFILQNSNFSLDPENQVDNMIYRMGQEV